MKLDEPLFIQAAAEGIGVYFSSGDAGDEVAIGNTTSAQPDFPASLTGSSRVRDEIGTATCRRTSVASRRGYDCGNNGYRRGNR